MRLLYPFNAVGESDARTGIVYSELFIPGELPPPAASAGWMHPYKRKLKEERKTEQGIRAM
jgi:hypothetical protein